MKTFLIVVAIITSLDALSVWACMRIGARSDNE